MKYLKRFSNWFDCKFGWFFTNGRKAPKYGKKTDYCCGHDPYNDHNKHVPEGHLFIGHNRGQADDCKCGDKTPGHSDETAVP